MSKNIPKKDQKLSRREFFLTSTRSAGLLVLGGLVWSAYVDEASSSPLILRPPGAVEENDFLTKCIKCGLCVEACPFDTLLLAEPGSNKPIGTPYFIPREVPCYMCVDIPCVPICPTDALDESLVTQAGKLNINKADMGLAIIDEKACIAFWGIQCDACHRACPLIDEAITIEYKKNERTGKHSFLTPKVHPDVCTGCGLCERACITEKASIFVLPRKLVTGYAGSHYIKGWDKNDEKRLINAKEIKTTTEISKRSPMDSLNDMGGLLDD